MAISPLTPLLEASEVPSAAVSEQANPAPPSAVQDMYEDLRRRHDVLLAMTSEQVLPEFMRNTFDAIHSCIIRLGRNLADVAATRRALAALREEIIDTHNGLTAHFDEEEALQIDMALDRLTGAQRRLTQAVSEE